MGDIVNIDTDRERVKPIESKVKDEKELEIEWIVNELGMGSRRIKKEEVKKKLIKRFKEKNILMMMSETEYDLISQLAEDLTDLREEIRLDREFILDADKQIRDIIEGRDLWEYELLSINRVNEVADVSKFIDFLKYRTVEYIGTMRKEDTYYSDGNIIIIDFDMITGEFKLAEVERDYNFDKSVLASYIDYMALRYISDILTVSIKISGSELDYGYVANNGLGVTMMTQVMSRHLKALEPIERYIREEIYG